MQLASLTLKLSTIDKHLQMRNQLYPRESHWRNTLLLMVACKPSSQWPTENELTCIIGDLLSCKRCFLKDQYCYSFIHSLFCAIEFIYKLWLPGLCFYMTPECEHQVFVSMCFLCLGFFFPSVYFALFQFVHFLFYLILFYYCPLGDFSFSSVIQMGGEAEWNWKE